MREVEAVRPLVTFEADFEDDSELSASGQIARPAGRNVADALRAMLENRGLTVSPRIQHSFYGWAFGAEDQRGGYAFLLQFPGPWLLMCESQVGLTKKVRPSSLSFRQLLIAMHEDLGAGPRFAHLRWFTNREYDRNTPGGVTP